MKVRSLLLATTFLALFALPLSAQINDTYVIPAAANSYGNYGTHWMTQVSIFNPFLDYDLTVSVTFIPTAGSQKAQEVLVTAPANGTAFTDNVLDEWFGTTGSGALLVATFPEDNPGVPDTVFDRSFLITTNTFNKTSDGGTYGQTVPGVFAGLQDYATDQISAVAHGVRQLSQYGWRTNYGAVNLGKAAVTLRINIFDRDGRTIIKNYAQTIPANSHKQWPLPREVDQGSIEFLVDDPSQQAVVFPYSSTLDRYTGDPTYQGPTLLANTKTLYPKAAMAKTSSIGRKLTTDDARAIRAMAVSKGRVDVKK